MTTFRGLLTFENGQGGKLAYATNGASTFETTGLWGLAANELVDIDTSSPYIFIKCGVHYLLQFSIDVNSANFRQSNFTTISATGGNNGASGVLEIVDATGPHLVRVVEGHCAFDGTDALHFTLVTEAPFGKP